MIDRTKEVQSLRFAPDDVKEQYWKGRVQAQEDMIELLGDDADYVQRSLYEVMKLAVQHEQYKFPDEDFEEVERVVKFRLNLPRNLIEDWYGVKTISLYGVGLFTTMKGLLLSNYQRRKTNFDDFSQKGVYYDLSRIPAEIVDNYNFDLAVPAMDGLFVPRRTVFSDEIGYRTRLQYFDIMMG